MPKKAEPVPQLTEAELARLEEEKANLESVQFRPAVVKHIISPHSGSILADPEPVIEISDVIEKKGRDIFNKYEEECGGSGSVPREKIAAMLMDCGYDLNQEIVESIVTQRCGDETIDERKWLTFLEEYQAPAYHYGQRLRKLSGRGQVKEMLELVVRGCNPNAGDGEGLTPLHYAAELNRIQVINALSELVGDALLVNVPDKYGWTPLHTAAHHGNAETVAVLLKLGADIHAKERTGKTPLHLAVAQGRNGICDMLIAAGVSLADSDHHGMTALHEAAYKSQEKTYQMLNKYKDVDLTLKDVLGYTAEQYMELS